MFDDEQQCRQCNTAIEKALRDPLSSIRQAHTAAVLSGAIGSAASHGRDGLSAPRSAAAARPAVRSTTPGGAPERLRPVAIDLRAYLLRKGGSINPAEVSGFYTEYPHHKEAMDGMGSGAKKYYRVSDLAKHFPELIE